MDVKHQVEFILNNYPDSRSSDKKLQVMVLKTFYNVQNIEDILRPEIPNLETIRRHRQRFQELGFYKATSLVQELREEQKQVYLEIASAKE